MSIIVLQSSAWHLYLYTNTRNWTARSVTGAALLIGALLASWACGPPEETRPNQTEFEMALGDACETLFFQESPPELAEMHVVVGRQGWLLLKSELHFLFAHKPWLIDRRETEDPVVSGAVDPLTAILHFDRELKKMGITLVVVPIPVRPFIYPESVLDPSALEEYAGASYRALWQKNLFGYLEARGCQAVDLTPAFIAQRSSGLAPVFIPTESHWTGVGAYIAGREIAAAVKRQSWFSSMERQPIQHEWITFNYRGNQSRRIEENLQGIPTLPTYLREVQFGHFEMDIRKVTLFRENRAVPIEPRNPGSPVVILGDSFVEFGAFQDFSVAHQLAFELGFPVDVLSTKGGGVNTARMNLIRTASSDPTYLNGKKCVIWCFTSRDMVGVQWFPFPFRCD